MATNIRSKGKQTGSAKTMFLDELRPGNTGAVIVMVCRKFDVNSVKDIQGNFMHCVAKKKIAHVFVDRLVEGGVYCLKGFDVENRTEYMLMEDKPFVINLQGETVVTKVSENEDITGFIRHPFKLTRFEDMKPTNVVGYVSSMGEQVVKSNGARTVEFSYCNERKRGVRVTLWGELGVAMIEKKERNPAVYSLILTSMYVKSYMNNLCLSSSYLTLLIDSDDVPALRTFNSSLSVVAVDEYMEPITEEVQVVDNLIELLDNSRDGKGKKKAVLFENTIEILNVRTKNSWYLFTCTGGQSRKGLERVSGHFKCKGCKEQVDYPRIRFRLELDVTDGVVSAVVVLFDETAEKMVRRSAKSLVEEQLADTSPDAPVLPPAIEALIGSKHVFQIKNHTYYHYGEYESFNCAKVIEATEGEMLGPAAGDSEHENVETTLPMKEIQSPSASAQLLPLKDPMPVDPIPTPAKKSSHKTRKFRVEDSDSDEVAEVAIDATVNVAKKAAKRRLLKQGDVVDDVADDETETIKAAPFDIESA